MVRVDELWTEMSPDFTPEAQNQESNRIATSTLRCSFMTIAVMHSIRYCLKNLFDSLSIEYACPLSPFSVYVYRRESPIKNTSSTKNNFMKNLESLDYKNHILMPFAAQECHSHTYVKDVVAMGRISPFTFATCPC